MGNGRIDLKLFVLSFVCLFISYFLIKIFDPNKYVIIIMLGISFIFMIVSGFFYSYKGLYSEFVFTRLFVNYDKKYEKIYKRKLELSKNDKYILKSISYKVHFKSYDEAIIKMFFDKNLDQIDLFLKENKWEINDRKTFIEVVHLISEYIVDKKILFPISIGSKSQGNNQSMVWRLVFESIALITYTYGIIFLISNYIVIFNSNYSVVKQIASIIGVLFFAAMLIFQIRVIVLRYMNKRNI